MQSDFCAFALLAIHISWLLPVRFLHDAPFTISAIVHPPRAQLAPIFEEAAATIVETYPAPAPVDGDSEPALMPALAKVDCDAHAELCQRFGVEGYPTLKVRNAECQTQNEYRKYNEGYCDFPRQVMSVHSELDASVCFDCFSWPLTHARPNCSSAIAHSPTPARTQLFHEGDDETPIDFEGERDADGIVAFVDRWMAPAVSSPSTPAEAREFIAESSAVLTVLVLFGDHSGAASEAAGTLCAHMMGRRTWPPIMARHFKIILYPPFRVEYQGNIVHHVSRKTAHALSHS